jgi:hypothetical protein
VKKCLYSIEYDNIVVYDWDAKRDCIFVTYAEAQITRHKVAKLYKERFPQYKTKFKDFKIVKYLQETEAK